MKDAYRQVIGDTPEEVNTPEEDFTLLQARTEWLSNTETLKMFRAITQQSDSLVSSAIGLALVNHSTDNSKQIVHKLIEADTLRKVVKSYASIK